MKVLMIPQPGDFHKDESGIRRVVEAYFKYLPEFGIELLPYKAKRYDVKAVHAGMTDADCDVAHLHGLYWTADYPATSWEYKANANIVEALRYAKEVTVPSQWVTETFQRDMRFTPHVIPHGIEWQEWQHKEPNEGYVLWNKNRQFDVCSTDDLGNLALSFPDIQFVSTFKPDIELDNLTEIGLVKHTEMKKYIQCAGVYLSTTKETFGLGTLEAMASGIPILGFRYGGNVDLVEHGVNGYLANPRDINDLREGLVYCLKHRQTLGDNGREKAKLWKWEDACEKVAGVYRLALGDEPAYVDVIIPVFNKTIEQLRRCIESVKNQTYENVNEIIVVDDGSDSELSREYDFIIDELAGMGRLKSPVRFYVQGNQGVANTRNNGISYGTSKYICCLDSDDWIEEKFLERCINELEEDSSLGIAYTGLQWHKGDSTEVSKWPSEWDFDKQVNYKKRQNQIPTCCVFRRKIWERLGGYRQRYAPDGAGAEDTEFWTRIGAYGWKAKKVTPEPLFNYSTGGQVGSNPDYREPDWLAWHPWSKDRQHPFASYATPEHMSHPVRQYDEPLVSVIIPVGKGHEKEVINALDSLEAQTFRRWEAVVIWDCAKLDKPYLKAYPYVKHLDTGIIDLGVTQYITADNKGAGFARNRGVEIARAPFLLFLDADDTLHPDCIEKMLDAWSQYEMAIYTDYVGQAFIDEKLAKQLQDKDRLQSYNQGTGEAIISYKSFDYDCERAQNQPVKGDLYIWNLITTLIPKQWHNEIGGFDENMETWEDWDYWIRQAKNGKCFHRIPEELVRYRFYTGTRRDKASADTLDGRQMASSMLEYMQNKDIEIMGCSKCPGGRKKMQVAAKQMASMAQADDNFIKVRYTGSRGGHLVFGQARFSQPIAGHDMRRRDNGYGFNYGYRHGDNIFYIHREDYNLMRNKFEEVPEIRVPRMEAEMLQEPVTIAANPVGYPDKASVLVEARARPQIEPPPHLAFDLQLLPGVTPKIAEAMRELGYDTKVKVAKLEVEDLVQIKGVGKTRAEKIIEYARK